VSRAGNGAEREENMGEREQSIERVLKKHLSGSGAERAELAAQSPLTPTLH